MKQTVLVIDDAVMIRDMLREILESEGLEVIEASDGEEALRVADQQTPDICIVDVFLPKRGGLSVMSELAQRIGAGRIIAITGGESFDAQTVLELAQPLKVADALPKPIDINKLLNSVRRILPNAKPRSKNNGGSPHEA
ncbi:MAG: response regulator [Oceanidesulfovibrio sp.]